jgi:S-adenosylmethionine:tRNA ribosyltransferase-isomerase
VRTSDFDYPLPPALIAQEPAPRRDQSRLMVVSRGGGSLAYHHFADLPQLLRPGDVLVLNDSRVIPARLRGVNARTGGHFEVLLLEENAPNDWWAMMRPGKRARVGTELVFAERGPAGGPPLGDPALHARVVGVNEEGHRRLVFTGTADLWKLLETLGEVPLPPYIERGVPNLRPEDRDRYQTVYARHDGSVAAPTAGLHFTEALLERLRRTGVEVCCVTLHVGLGTFAPVKVETLAAHVMHEERFEVCPETARQVNAARQSGRRVVAVGTTAVRVLESLAASHEGRMVPGVGRTRIFIHPPYSFRVVDALLTNFHLPRSTLLMLVSAFASPGTVEGRRLILAAYAEAVRERYRFFSYGDAMLIL